MPTLDWLQKEFNYGYDSGNVLSLFPDPTRRQEEKIIGGSYRKVFYKAAFPHIKANFKVLELGPGKGSWTRAILKYIPQGQLHVVDFQKVEQWLNPDQYNGRLVCHMVTDNSFSCLEDDSFDFFWSFGVLCHNNIEQIEMILRNALSKVKPGGMAAHQYSDWNKLEAFGWVKGSVPLEFKNLPDDKIWWPRNNQETMATVAKKAGWTVIKPDLGIVQRDSIILLRRD
ncbi:MAG: class I SAM-dependent methyltransferase [Oculatellaceae cyanobacterium bins.114]|nr:class I SAM-dependent methyltransferase [Oculatellaceae cyanobacterium bins.114]